MTTHAPASELLPLPACGRRYATTSRVRLGDVDPRGLMRLDAIARCLQDVAADDAADSGLDPAFGWVVRRTLVAVARPPVLAEDIDVTTFCTGTGRSWAERRTSIAGRRGGSVEAVSLWIQVDATTGRPTGLGEQFHDRYGEAAGGRRVSTRLALPGPPTGAELRPWSVRATDLDVFDHVNNASHWPILEEVLAGPEFGRVGVAEIEYLVPIAGDTPVELHVAGTAAWLVAGCEPSESSSERTRQRGEPSESSSERTRQLGRVHTAARWSAGAHGPIPPSLR